MRPVAEFVLGLQLETAKLPVASGLPGPQPLLASPSRSASASRWYSLGRL